MKDGTVQRLDVDGGGADRLCSVELPVAEPDHKPWAGHPLTPRLHASIDGTFGAIVNDYVRRHLNVQGRHSFQLPEFAGARRALRDPDAADDD